jgi:hypothetical protein
MSIYKISIDTMSIDKMSIDKMSIDKMPVDKVYLYLNDNRQNNIMPFFLSELFKILNCLFSDCFTF